MSLPEKALEAVSVSRESVLPGQVTELRVHPLVEVLTQEERPKSEEISGYYLLLIHV